jgi:hypothetical protein
MRLSSLSDSEHFDPEYPVYLVCLDGKPVEMCVEACEEEGWADVLVAKDRRERRFGTVTIQRLQSPAPMAPPPPPPMHTTREIDPDEAMRLVEGLVPEFCRTGGALDSCDDNAVLLSFALSCDREVRYIAERVSDYYGGHYTNIRWEIDEPIANPASDDGGSG